VTYLGRLTLAIAIVAAVSEGSVSPQFKPSTSRSATSESLRRHGRRTVLVTALELIRQGAGAGAGPTTTPGSPRCSSGPISFQQPVACSTSRQRLPTSHGDHQTPYHLSASLTSAGVVRSSDPLTATPPTVVTHRICIASEVP
jgi:hypothetical protein